MILRVPKKLGDEDEEVVEKILKHLGLWDVKSRPLVPPASPKQLVWKS